MVTAREAFSPVSMSAGRVLSEEGVGVSSSSTTVPGAEKVPPQLGIAQKTRVRRTPNEAEILAASSVPAAVLAGLFDDGSQEHGNKRPSDGTDNRRGEKEEKDFQSFTGSRYRRVLPSKGGSQGVLKKASEIKI